MFKGAAEIIDVLEAGFLRRFPHIIFSGFKQGSCFVDADLINKVRDGAFLQLFEQGSAINGIDIGRSRQRLDGQFFMVMLDDIAFD
ncbi:hypothetical protein D3C81_2065390 [compost metagenome]